MSTIAVNGGLARYTALYQSTLGKKAIMAVTGTLLFGFVMVHMIGNLQLFAGPEKLNAYAELLQKNKGLVWGARLALLAAVGMHIVTAIQLYFQKKAARPVGYVKKVNTTSTYSSRSMIITGLMVLAFIVYHILHFTTGTLLPGFKQGDVYHNVITGFQNPAVSFFYIFANLLLALHLYHGLWSLFQTLGLVNPKLSERLRMAAAGFAVIIGAGNVSMPLAVLTGLVK